ncbi:alkaline phytoceramidase [Trichodelitschia bisporula]|uniref:Alkaline phytoceramidase n=1 Tax=Trichodelitschia bisporula TaxID=703511 RepID=A0A6G1HQC7_9PEZI|nr:alkaline phytoceramidase [Trichodelitschia bisporula]
MPSWLPSTPYPAAKDGFWGPVTSTLNWCEEDYYASHYLAEIVNSLTNLIFVVLAFKGIANCLRNGHDTVFVVAFVSYLLVGLGSFFFHATLLYPMQLVDELSMIYTTSIMTFALFTRAAARPARLFFGLLVASLAAFITAYYVYLGDPLFHQNAFAVLTAFTILRSLYIMETRLRPSRRCKDLSLTPAEQARRDVRDDVIVTTMWRFVGLALAAAAGGFAIWNLDTLHCDAIRRWRHRVGLPWGVLLEGHGWWHILTGISAYYQLMWGVWLRYCLNGQQDDVEMVWPSMWSVPVVEKVSAKKRN